MLFNKRQPSLKDKQLKEAGMPTEKLAKDVNEKAEKKVVKAKATKVEKKSKKSKKK